MSKRTPAMTPESMRRNLRDVVEQIATVETEREALLALIRGYEAWLQINERQPAQRPQEN